MNFDPEILSGEERLALALRTLYHRSGYTQYKMSKFEEYDLYARNKDFLISDNILTFTDAGGRLMALKPDVTLSIVRSGRDRGEGVQKLYYQENVYRPGASGAFRELTQVGVECIGAVGEADKAETLLLALRSLECVSDEYRFDVSHLGVLSALLNRLAVSEEARQEALRCVAQKNAHELSRLCESAGADSAAAADLKKLFGCAGAPETVIPVLRELGCGEDAAELERLTGALAAEGFAGKISLDFSIAGNLNYYNGVVFRGFVSGVPAQVLSGGQYDRLMLRQGRRDRAIGFAVYMDLLERVGGERV